MQVCKHVLVSYLTNGLLNFGVNLFQREVIVPTWSTLSKINKTVNWTTLLERP